LQRTGTSIGIAEQLAAAMATIHEASFSMEDLVPGQFLITGTPNFAVKVGDIDSLRRVPKRGSFKCFCWGGSQKASHLAASSTSSSHMNTKQVKNHPAQAAATQQPHQCGYERTPKRNKHCLAWRSPEQIHCKPSCTQKSDVFSLAMVLWALMPHTGKPYGEWPYGDPRDGVTREKVILRAGVFKPKIPKDCPSEYSALVHRCWANDPSQRPTMAELAATIAAIREDRHRVHVWA